MQACLVMTSSLAPIGRSCGRQTAFTGQAAYSRRVGSCGMNEDKSVEGSGREPNTHCRRYQGALMHLSRGPDG